MKHFGTSFVIGLFTFGVEGFKRKPTTDPLGNVTEILETPECAGGGSTLVLENQTVTTEETFTSCADLQAGGGFAVDSPGNVTFQAQGEVVLTNGFSVGSGASFAAGSGTLPTFSDRTYTYQPPQYFLTSADGPWGSLDWSYDKIGDRLSESRDGGASADGYQYTTNASAGDTPILDLVNLAVGGTRDYAWDAAGNLDQVATGTGGNSVDFTFDDASRLAGADRTSSGGDVADFLYDGRGFLRSAVEMAGDPLAEAASVEPLYDSGGLLHALRRRPSPTDPVDTTYVFYLAGRPVAQLEIDGTGAESWQYLTTDHLGTPLVATDQSGAITWEGGFQPFGTDYQAGMTGVGASENGVDLRLPGQWVSDVWDDATSGAGVYYSPWRWLEPATGRFTRREQILDPELMDLAYAYAGLNPLTNFDPLGRVTLGSGVECDNFDQIVQHLKELKNNCSCIKFFGEKLRANLPAILDQPLPYLYVKPDPTIYTVVAHPGKFDCRSQPNRIYIGVKLCRKPWFFKQRRILRATQIALHELAHWADCNFNHGNYPGEEGYAAERASFGHTVGNPPSPQPQ